GGRLRAGLLPRRPAGRGQGRPAGPARGEVPLRGRRDAAPLAGAGARPPVRLASAAQGGDQVLQPPLRVLEPLPQLGDLALEPVELVLLRLEVGDVTPVEARVPVETLH